MSTTYQSYKDRVHYKGTSKKEYVNTKVDESIDSLISDSQYGFKISIDDKNYDVAILSTKSTQDYEKANIIAPNSVGLDRGTIFNWNDNKWIILQKMFRPEQPGFNGYAYKCTGQIKWIDENGTLHTQDGYINSGRTTNSLTYTPDVNRKFDDIVLQDSDWSMIAAVQQNLEIHDQMRFIIKGSAYRVTNVDNVSIENVSIISMVDDKLLDSDDVVNGIAYTTDYSLRLQVESPVNLYAGDIKDIPVSVIKNGNIVDEEIVYVSSDSNIIEIKDNKLIGRGLGNATVKCSLKKNSTITASIQILVAEEHIQDVEEVYIVGSDYINWNSSETYRLSNGDLADFSVEYKSNIGHSETWLNGIGVTISVKDKYSGSIIIYAALIDGKEISKEIDIKTA